MERIRVLFPLIALCLLLCACGGQKETSEAEENQLSIWDGGGSLATGERQEITDPPETWPVTDELTQMEPINMNPETDGNPYLSLYYKCETDDAYYHVRFADESAASKIFRFDKKQHTYGVLCSRPDCRHEEGCVASGIWGQSISYYNGKIYAVAEEGERVQGEETGTIEFVLYEIDPDGHSRRAVQTLVRVEIRMRDGYTAYDPRFVIHRGYVYYWHHIGNDADEYDVYRNGKNCIWRVPLGGSEEDAECLFALEKYTLKRARGPKVQPYGNYIYFLDQDLYWMGHIYRINLKDQKVERLPIGDNIEYYHVTDDGVYGIKITDRLTEEATAEGTVPTYAEIMVYRFATGTVEVAWKGERGEYDYGMFYHDGTYFYISCLPNTSDSLPWTIYVFDHEFQQVGKVELDQKKGFIAWNGGSKDQLIFFTNGNVIMGWADKSKIGTDEFVAHRIGE